MTEKFRCPECNGTAWRRDDECMTCDGRRNPLKVVKPKVEKQSNKKKNLLLQVCKQRS